MIRARELGIPFDGATGAWNAITDVAGVEVGYATLVSGDAVRTGVTAILPRGKASCDPVFAGWFPLNGNGEMTGTAWVEESGFLEGPIGITNTHSVGVVRDAIVKWQVRKGLLFQPWSTPVVAETCDGRLNDINGFHVTDAHAYAALDTAASGPLKEGNVGGGTGMVCFGFKGGTGTASRVVAVRGRNYAVGVLVQANFGFCTSSPGSYSLMLLSGYPEGKVLQSFEFAIRLGIKVTQRRICFRDLYDLLNWSSECSAEQVIEIEDGYHHLTICTNLPPSGIRGDNQRIVIWINRLSEMPELTWTGVPILC